MRILIAYMILLAVWILTVLALPVRRKRRKVALAFPVCLAIVVACTYSLDAWYHHLYPYGWSHCCLKGLGLTLENYAETHGGRFPAGAGCPEASLSLLYREHLIDAETLRGKTVPEETVKSILERGELLGPDTCGWHYVEGLTTSDDSRLALVWDKVGLDHFGGNLNGGHSVWFLHRGEEIVPASDWPQFLELQETLMARAERTRQPRLARLNCEDPLAVRRGCRSS